MDISYDQPDRDDNRILWFQLVRNVALFY